MSCLETSDRSGGPKLQVAPVGATVYYGRLNYKKQIAYRVTCTCGGTVKEVSKLLCVPHEIRHWAEKHGDCKPEFRALKALEDEQYSLLAGFDAERNGDPRYKKYQKRMRDLGFLSTVPMLEARGYCLPEEAQARYDSLYPKRGRNCRAQVRRVSSTEDSASQSEDPEDMDYDHEDVSHSKANTRRRRPQHVSAAAAPSRKRARKAPAAGRAMRAEPAEPAGSHGQQDAAAESTHRMKPAKKSRGHSPARELHAAAVSPSIKVEPATSLQPPPAPNAAADNAHTQRRANVSMSVAPSGQLTCAASPDGGATVQSDVPDTFIKAEPAGSAEPPVTPDAAVEGTRKRRRTCAMQPDVAWPTAPNLDAPVDSLPLAAGSTPARGQALSDDLDGVDLTLDSPASSAEEGSLKPRTGGCTLSDVISDINRLKAVQLHNAAGGVHTGIDIDNVLECLQAASAQERRRTEQLEARINELQAEASAERRNHQALLELQRLTARNEKLLAAKDNEIKALREQVELQRG
ncbi:hypothetical protein COCOBI_18-1200 [Coccomyxa sp. Obi]|nr:hypothetical protein COCOBI_18-1200 [Coccomyxa sp. Obi]